jgi:transcriptional regulator with XRE-family HTH domain
LLKLTRLKEARELAGLSQDELATTSGVARATVADLELGKRMAQPRTARRLAETLGVGIRELLEESVAPLAEAPKAQAPSSPEVSDEERRITDLGRWAEYIERRAWTWMQQATAEENPYLNDWRVALRWGSDVSEESLELFVATDEVARSLMPGGTAEGLAAEALQRLEESYNRLWEARSAVGRRVGETLDSFAARLGNVPDLRRERRKVAEEEERRNERIEALQERRGA